MGKTRYSRALSFVDSMKKKYGDRIHFDIVRNEMLKTIGGDETRTIKPYFRLMLDLKLIEEVDEFVIINGIPK